MASLGISTNDPVTKKLWDEMSFREVRKDAFISKYMGPSSDSLIYEKTNLKKGEGDRIRFTIFPRVEAPVITGSSGQSLEGKEGKIEWFTHDVNLEEYKTGFRYKTGLDEHRPFFSISDENARALDRWGSEIMDDLWFDAIQSAPTREILAGAVANVDALTVNDKLGPITIRRCAALAKAGFASGSNARTTYPFQMVMVNGKKYFVLLVHPYACYDMKNNAEYQGYVKEARERSKENPIFQDAVAVIDNVIVIEHENILIKRNVGGVYYCTGVLLGAGSSVWAWGKRPVVIDKSWGYDEERGVGRKFIAKTEKVKFKFKATDPAAGDYGSCAVFVAITDVANAE